MKKNKRLLQAFGHNHFPGRENTLESVFDLADAGAPGAKHGNKASPMETGYGPIGAVALSSCIDWDKDALTRTLDEIEKYLNAELESGEPETVDDITPRQWAVIELEPFMEDIRNAIGNIETDICNITTAIAFGAAIMRLAMQEPDSELCKWISNKEQNAFRAVLGGKARATCTDEQIEAAFTEYRQRNPRNSYASAESFVARKLGYSNPRKLGERIKRMTGNTPAKWYKTLP